MNSFGSMTVEACMKNYIQENKLKDDDVINGVREKCPICEIEMYNNNFLESFDEATTFFTCSNCGFEKQTFYKVDIEGNLAYEKEKVVFTPEGDKTYDIKLKVDTIFKWKDKRVGAISWLKLNKSEVKHLRVLLQDNLKIYNEVLTDEENDIVPNKKLIELKNIIDRISKL
ncbi:hypothetical protein KTC96_06775 [Clostridium estertheticum]|uniref:hypothetical protein n=1 Tax=Clostridium estertheticum TaxID=238834 RepID=UPI001C7D4C0E|nr:hypothetical protein [Clostridium estertheticum]MBX4261260.1 hypothetical protein [Clostridium estertheticum]WLC71700.1 hypothetical protein KTC96_06775 [Clostridium estertheticum]